MRKGVNGLSGIVRGEFAWIPQTAICSCLSIVAATMKILHFDGGDSVALCL